MSDHRFTDLRQAQQLEGLPPEYADLSQKSMTADNAARWALLYRGYVYERGQLMGGTEATKRRGADAGRVLLTALLDDNSQSESRPNAVLTYEEWEAYTKKLTNQDNPINCTRLLDLLYRVTTEINTRRKAQLLKP